MSKNCNKCLKTLPLSEFHNRTRSKDGKAHRCKKCVSLNDKKRYETAPEYFAKRYQEWIEVNREYKAEIDRKWKQSERGQDSIRNSTHIRRTLTRTGEKVTLKMVTDLHGIKCLVPGCVRLDVQMDHIIPLSLGGTHTLDNLQPLCAYHNNVKGNRNSMDYRGVSI